MCHKEMYKYDDEMNEDGMDRACCMIEKEAHATFGRKTKGSRALGIFGGRWDDNIRRGPREMGWK
jgi:hypothetical protein